VSGFFFFFLCIRVLMACSPRRLSREDADRPEQLVPIRLEFDVEHQKMRDTFVWNINGVSFHPL
jgi:hypothetical protein